MAANDFTTMTPGSGVADALQDILTRKRNDARQAMLDDITKRATDARIRYEDETAKSMAVAREGRAEEQRSLAAKNMLAGLGDAPAPLDQETYNKIHQYAPTRVSMTPAQNTLPSTQFSDAGVQQVPATPAPASYRYNGSPAYQQRQDTQKGLEGLANDPSFARLDDLHKLLKISSLFPQANPEAAIERLLTSKTEKGDGHLYGVDPATHKRIDLGPIGPNDRSMEFSRAPQTPAASTPDIPGTIEDPVTHEKRPTIFRVTPNRIDPKTGLVNYPTGFTPDGGKLGVARPPTAVKPAKISDKSWAEYLNAKAASLKAPDDPNTENLLNSQANKIIAEGTADPVSRAFLSEAWRQRPARMMSSDQLFSKLKAGSTPLTDAQKSDISSIWNQIKFDPLAQ